MKILYLDFLYPEGHIRQNTTYISLLSNIAKVYILSPKGRYKELPPEVEVIENDALKIRDGKLLNRLSSLNIMVLSAIEARKLKPDYIFISSYETMVFAIGRLLFQRTDKLFLLQHFNVDELRNKVKRLFFKSYMKKVNHIVFEDFIREYLINNFRLEANTIYVLPHQLNQILAKNNELKYSCVGLSSSNDESIILQIIDIEAREELLKRAGLKVILKSKSSEFDNGFLKVVKGYLEDEQYDEYIDNSICIYMPFPSSFCYRMSGTLVDALSNNKILLGSNIPIIQHYTSQYPNICKIINSAEDFFECLLNIEMSSKNEQVKEFEKFKIAHSNRKITEAFINMIDVNVNY